MSPLAAAPTRAAIPVASPPIALAASTLAAVSPEGVGVDLGSSSWTELLVSDGI